MSDADTLTWLLTELNIDREWADHAATCDECWLDLGQEYGGAFHCRPYQWDHNEVMHGPRKRPTWLENYLVESMQQALTAWAWWRVPTADTQTFTFKKENQ